MTRPITTPLLIYIAGPYTPRGGGDIDAQLREVEENLRVSVQAAEAVLARGHTPFIPHTHTNGFASRTSLTQTTGLYYAWDNVILARCDAIYRYACSPGADAEWALAGELGLLRFEKAEDIPRYVPEPAERGRDEG